MRPLLNRALIAQRLMWALLVVPLYPSRDDAPCLVERLEHVLPGTLFFEAQKKSLGRKGGSAVASILQDYPEKDFL